MAPPFVREIMFFLDKVQPATSDTIHNARIQLSATYANNISVGLLVGGAVLPFFVGPIVLLKLVGTAVAWLIAAWLHAYAYHHLDQLRGE
jgi:hypothetical protein